MSVNDVVLLKIPLSVSIGRMRKSFAPNADGADGTTDFPRSSLMKRSGNTLKVEKIMLSV